GNKVTKSWVIQKLLGFSHGDSVTPADLAAATQKLYKSDLFSSVSVHAERLVGDEADVVIEVKEKWYIYPFPVIGLRDRDWKKFYGGLGIRDNNFLGRNEKLTFEFALGYDPFVNVTFISPWVGNSHNYLLTLRGNISRGRLSLIESQDYASNLDNLYGDASVSLTRLFGSTITASGMLAYNYVLNKSTGNTTTVSVTGRDVFASAGINMIFDTRNVKWFPTRGDFISIGFNKYGLGESQVNFARFELDARKFISISPSVSFAARIHGNIAEGPTIPPYYDVFIGYGERIRGMFSTIQEGQSMIGSNLEMRFLLLRDVPLDFPFGLAANSNPIKLEIYWSFFGDAGETYKKGDVPSYNRLLYGYGGGLTFVMPFNLVAQLAIARGKGRNLETILVLGATI
ncbi:MAG: BamA/TamA family outer membrane protein, partial [Candidatus Kryptoniota bacterium]